MSRGLLIALCALASSACLKEPKFNGTTDPPNEAGIDAPGDANTSITCVPSATDITVNRSGEMQRGANVCGPGYQMVFSDLGARMPYQLNVGGSQLMAGAENCNDERGTGLAIYPAALINGENQSPAIVDGMLMTPLTGPLVAKVSIDWSATYTCTGQGTLQNLSTFTFFPDGRITRFERLSQTEQVGAAGCGVCAGGGSGPTMYLTSYMNLTAPSNATLTGAVIGDLVSYDQSVSGMRSACLGTLGQKVAFGWRDAATRIRVTNTTPRSLAFVYDIASGNSIGPIAATEVTTYMLVSSTTQCADLAMDAQSWADRPGLRVQGNNMGPALDGIYGGENDNGDTAIMTVVGDVVLQLNNAAAPIPGGWAVWIDFGSQPNTNVQVLHNGVPSAPSGQWFRTQRIGTEVIFWFRDPLVDVGTVITIQPG